MNPYGKHECKNDFHNPGCWKSGWAHKIHQISSSYIPVELPVGWGQFNLHPHSRIEKKPVLQLNPTDFWEVTWLLPDAVFGPPALRYNKCLLSAHLHAHARSFICWQLHAVYVHFKHSVFLHACQCILMVLRDLEDSGGVLLSGWILRPRMAPQPIASLQFQLYEMGNRLCAWCKTAGILPLLWIRSSVE